MASTSTGHRGFTLIELLVVIAVSTVLIGLLLPAVTSVREAAAAKAAAELRDKSYDTAALCTPSECNWLVDSLNYPEIPDTVQLDGVLESGLSVSYDPAALLNGQPFSLQLWSDQNISDPGIVTMDITVYALADVPYAVEAVRWLDGELEFIVRQPEDGQRWKLQALVAPETPPIRVVAEPVPEPTSLSLVAAALLGLGVVRRRSLALRSARQARRD